MIFLILLLIMGCYVLWETKAVHAKASKGTWKSYKPSSGNTLSFEDLRQLNPDVIGWIDIYGTGIDYPVLHSDAVDYLFKDAKGKPSSIGSIFLDKRNSPDFSDGVSVIHGHHMNEHTMFGDIDLFKKQDFFDSHLYGNLYFQDKDHGLKIVGVISTTSNDNDTYNLYISGFSRLEKFLTSLKEESKPVRDTSLQPGEKIVLLSTCSNSSTEARSVLVTILTDEVFDDPFGDEYEWPGVEDLEGWLGFPWSAWICLIIVIIMIATYILWQIEKRKKEQNKHNNVNYGAY